MTKFLTTTNQFVLSCSQAMMMNSNSGGKTNAKTVEHTAPISDNSKSNFGMTIATVNVINTINVLNVSSPING